MKIIIDSTWMQINQWENGKIGKKLLSYYGFYNAISFSRLVEQILTHKQYELYCIGSHDYVYSISKKREIIMFNIIDKIEKDNR